MTTAEHCTLTLGLAMLHAAWSPLAQALARVEDPELSEAWIKVSDALESLDGALRRRSAAARFGR